MRRLLFAGVMFVLLAAPVSAQEEPVRGMVWTPPANFGQAERDLRAMHARGVEAVRTPPVRDERLLAVADTLGLQWYQELPLAYLSAGALGDTLNYARAQLDTLTALAQRHPSMRHFGLLQLGDTSDPAICSLLQQLAQAVQNEGPPGSQTYYVTPFTVADRCASVVDAVLLDTRRAAHPMQALRAWQAAHPETPAGLGALGTWVRSDTLRGLRTPHTPEAQARYLEQHLEHAFADTLQASPSVVFVYRWRDTVDTHSDPYGRAYGLHADDNRARPAADVVEGFFTGTKTVFAFPSGQSPGRSVPWPVLLGWGWVALLAVTYFRGPRFQSMVMRYFWAHNFYQESVREGREVLVGSTLVLLGGVLVSVAILTTVTARAFQDVADVLWALEALPPPLDASLASLMATPWRLGLVSAIGYSLSLLLWAGLLVGAGRYRRGITTGQALMLVVWPRWVLVLVMAAALTVSAPDPETGRTLLRWLWSITGVLMLWMAGRTVTDAIAVMRVPSLLVAGTVLFSPLFVALWIAVGAVVWYDVPITFLHHLLTRT